MSSLTMSPWSDSNELMTVYESIYQNDGSDSPGVPDYQLLIFARNKLTIWLTRMQNNIEINVNLMATKEIINALIEDSNKKSDPELNDESSVYSLYALSVIRFCSAISQYSCEDNMKSVRRLAHRYSCPQWIIDCRHNLCHSSANQPTLEELRMGAMIGLNWLRQYFWLKLIDKLNVRSDYNNRNYFDLIDKYLTHNCNNNNNKSKTRFKNEIILGLKHSRNESIIALIQHLINANNCETNINYESLKVKKLYLKKFSKLFAIIVRFNSVSIVLNLLVDHFDCDNPSKRHLAMSWFSTLIKAIESDTSDTKFKSIFKCLTYSQVMPRIEWIRLLYKVVKKPNPKTPALIQLIAPIVRDVLPEEKIKILVNLSQNYCNTSEDESKDNCNQEFEVKTIEDLKSTTDRINDSDFDTNEWSIPINWSKINLGASV